MKNVLIVGLMLFVAATPCLWSSSEHGSEPAVREFSAISVYRAPARHGASEQPVPVKIRLLILKHAREAMTDTDANLASQAASKAAGRGLAIKVVGNEYATTIAELQDKLARFGQLQAEAGDTLVVHTIGHGFANGGLMGLGQRSEVEKVMSRYAEQNQQEILWWQLSCHAAARLTPIGELSPEQQALFSVLASSTAERLSPSREQAMIMEKVFIALAEGGSAIDANGDGAISAGELADFLNHLDQSRRGDLLFARSREEIIFGEGNWANLIPIFDRNGPQGKYPKNYIPLPHR